MNAVPRRLGLGPSVLALALTLVACSSPADPVAPSGTPPRTPVATPTLPPSGGSPAPSPAPTAPPNQGNVDHVYPELTVTQGAGYVVEVVDPIAKAWRVEARGSGLLGEDWLEVVVETGDVRPGVEVRIYVRGGLVDVFELSGLTGSSTAAAGGCHPTIDVCVGSGGITIDPETGRLSVVVEQLDAGDLQIRGGSASWTGEPFILGPWRTTEAFTTG